MPSKQIALTIYGQKISGISFAIGESVLISLACEDPTNHQALDLTGDAVIFSLCALDAQDNPIHPPLISRQANLIDESAGLAAVPLDYSDTVPAGIPFKPGRYGWDIWADNGTSRLRELAYGFIELEPAAGLPGAMVTPLPSQLPLATGPQGNAGAAGAAGPTGPTGPAGTFPSTITRTADGVLGANLCYKPSAATAGRFIKMATNDVNLVFVGVSSTSAAGAGSTYTGTEVAGQQVSVFSDGTTAIAPGDVLEISPNTAGMVRKGTTYPILVALSVGASGGGAVLVNAI